MEALRNSTEFYSGFFLGTIEAQSLTKASFTNLFVYGAFFVEGLSMILGNALLICVIMAYKALRRKEMYIMAGLAMGDLLYGTGFFFSGIRRTYLALKGMHVWKVTPWHCMTALQNPFFIAGSQAAAFMLVMLSVDRLLAVRWFAYYMGLGTRYSRSIILIVFLYCFATVPMVYLLSYFGTERVASVPAICISTHVGPGWFSSYQPTVQMMCGIFSVLIYLLTWYFYKKQFQSMSQNVQNQQLERQRKLTRTVGITVLCTFCCYVVPHSMIFFFNTFQASKHLAGLMSPYGWVLSNINSIANIFILTVHNSGIVGLLHRNEADVSTTISYLPSRAKVMDYSVPAIRYKKQAYLVHSPGFSPLVNIWKPFSRELWIGWFLSYILCVLLCVASTRLMKGGSKIVCLMEKYSYGLLFLKRSKTLWRLGNTKILLASWNLISKFAMLAFAAFFVRYCSPREENVKRINSLGDLAEAMDSSGYKLVAPSLEIDTYQRFLIPKPEEPKQNQKLRLVLKRHPILVVGTKALKYTVSTPKTVYLNSEYLCNYELYQLAKVKHSNNLLSCDPETNGYPRSENIGFRKNSSFYPQFSVAIQAMHEYGFSLRLMERYGFTARASKTKSLPAWHRLPLLSVQSPIVYLCSAYCVCVLVALFEMWHS